MIAGDVRRNEGGEKEEGTLMQTTTAATATCATKTEKIPRNRFKGLDGYIEPQT